MDLNGKRLRLLYPDIHGLERGKYLFGKVAESGHAAFCVGVYPLTHDREILMVPNTQFDVGLPDIDVELDRESLRPSWEPETVIGIGDVHYQGGPAVLDPRHALHRAVEAWRSMGLEPQISFELEFYLMEPDGGGGWRPVSLPGHRVYGTGMSVDPTGLRRGHGHDGAGVRLPRGELEQRVRRVRLRGEHPLQRRDPCGR